MKEVASAVSCKWFRCKGQQCTTVEPRNKPPELRTQRKNLHSKDKNFGPNRSG